MGMSLTLIEAAVTHITQMQPGTFGLSPSVEVDSKIESASGSKPEPSRESGAKSPLPKSTATSSKQSAAKSKKIERNHVEKIVKNQRMINDTVNALL